MSKKLILSFAVALFLFSCNFALADLTISQIMYDPPGRDAGMEWIKIQNTGGSSADVSSWYVADYDTSWHFHKIVGENTTLLPAGAYALIANTSQAGLANFKTKTPNWAGLIFRASFTLANEKGRLALSPDKKNIISDTSYVASPAVQKTPAVLSALTNPPTQGISPLVATSPNPVPIEGRANIIDTGVSARQDLTQENNPNSSSIIPVIIFALFISASAVTVHLIRQKRIISQAGEDFEILDE